MTTNAPIVLYQLPVSHYCEKVRWALEYKGLAYRTINLMPGKHIFTVKKIAPKSSVPVIQHDKSTIQDSTAIIDYLDEVFPSPSLTPQNADKKKQALEIEEFADQEIGPHLRRFFYNHILKDKTLTCALLATQATLKQQKMFEYFFSVIRFFMKRGMKITPANADKSEMKLIHAMDKLSAHLKNKTFMVGSELSRADITVAALLAPLCTPPEHAFAWPAEDQWPKPLIKFRNRHTNDRVYQWVLKVYKEHRINQLSPTPQ